MYGFSCALSEHNHWHEACFFSYNPTIHKCTSSPSSRYARYVCGPPSCPYFPSPQHRTPPKRKLLLVHGCRRPLVADCSESLVRRQNYRKIMTCCPSPVGEKLGLRVKSRPFSAFWQEASEIQGPYDRGPRLHRRRRRRELITGNRLEIRRPWSWM